MTIMTLKIDDTSQEIIETFKMIASNFKGVSFEIETSETKEEVLDSFRTAMKDIASGEGIKNAKPIEELFKELAND